MKQNSVKDQIGETYMSENETNEDVEPTPEPEQEPHEEWAVGEEPTTTEEENGSDS